MLDGYIPNIIEKLCCCKNMFYYMIPSLNLNSDYNADKGAYNIKSNNPLLHVAEKRF